MALLNRHIRVSELRPNEALQEFAKQVEQAVKDGYSVSGGVKYHAVFLDVCEYMLTMTKIESSSGNTKSVAEVQLPPMSWEEYGEVELPTAVEAEEISEEEACATADTQVRDKSTLQEELAGLSKKDELLAFAASHNVAVPEDLRVVTSIKKYIKNALT